MSDAAMENAYRRAVAAMVALREAWEEESHSTVEGRARIDAALAEYNAAATALTEEWNRRDEEASRPTLEPLDTLRSASDESAPPEQEIGGPTD